MCLFLGALHLQSLNVLQKSSQIVVRRMTVVISGQLYHTNDQWRWRAREFLLGGHWGQEAIWHRCRVHELRSLVPLLQREGILCCVWKVCWLLPGMENVTSLCIIWQPFPVIFCRPYVFVCFCLYMCPGFWFLRKDLKGYVNFEHCMTFSLFPCFFIYSLIHESMLYICRYVCMFVYISGGFPTRMV